MNKCPRCGENNPAEVHTCTPGYNFTEHEKLEEIADKIGYIIDREFIYDVREIIFTPEFMEKFTTYYCFTKGYAQIERYYQYDILDIFNNLDNPVEYLYNLIKE